MKPVELLEEELNKYKRALAKSAEALLEGKINNQRHQSHRENLTPKIKEFEYAIRILKDNTE
jgi:GTPase involved in cell partitioning and DNA repair